MRVCKGLLLLALCLCCGSTALAEAYQAEDGRVKYDAAIDFPQGGEVPLLNAVSLSPQREALISAFRLTEADAAGLECLRRRICAVFLPGRPLPTRCT